MPAQPFFKLKVGLEINEYLLIAVFTALQQIYVQKQTKKLKKILSKGLPRFGVVGMLGKINFAKQPSETLNCDHSEQQDNKHLRPYCSNQTLSNRLI